MHQVIELFKRYCKISKGIYVQRVSIQRYNPNLKSSNEESKCNDLVAMRIVATNLVAGEVELDPRLD
jgi:hypothetical protein